MSLNPGQIRYLKKHAGRKSAEELAKRGGIPLKEVKEWLEQQNRSRKDPVAATKTNLSRNLWLVLIFITPLFFWSALYDSAEASKKTLFQAGVLLLLILWLKENSAELKLRLPAVFFPLAAIVIWSFLSIFFCHAVYPAIQLSLQWLFVLLFFLLSVQFMRDEAAMVKALQILAFSGALVSLLGMANYLLEWSWPPQSGPPASTFGNRNMAMDFIVIVFPLQIFLLLKSREKTEKFLNTAALTVTAIYIVYTGTRAAWLSAALVSLVAIMHMLRNRSEMLTRDNLKHFAAAALLFLFFAHLSPHGFINRFLTMTDRITEKKAESSDAIGQAQSSAQTRLIIWKNIISQPGKFLPLGAGADNFRTLYPELMKTGIKDREMQLGTRHFNAHNDYLQFVTEFGIPGIIAAVALILLLVRVFFPKGGKIPVFLLLAVLGSAVTAFFSFPWYRSAPPLALSVVLAAACSRTENSEILLKGDWGKKILPVVSVAALVHLYFLFSWWQAETWLRKTEENLLARRYDAVLLYGGKTLDASGSRIEAVQSMGQAHLMKGALSAAEENFNLYRIQYPLDAHNLYHLAEVHRRRATAEGFRNAIALLQTAMEISPFSGRLHDSLAQIHWAENRLAEAEAEFRKATELERNAELFYNLGFYYYKQADYRKAVEPLEQAVKLQPDSANYRGLLGTILYFRLNEKEKGLPHLRIAYQLDSRLPNAEEIRKVIGK